MICSWGDFDLLKSRCHSAFPSEESAREYAFKIGLSEDRNDEGTAWFEIQKIRFRS